MAGGLGLGVDFSVGPAKASAEASMMSEGKYTLSGKATVSAVKEAKLSVDSGPWSRRIGYASGNSRHYNGLGPSAAQVGPTKRENHLGWLMVPATPARWFGPGCSRFKSESA